MKSKVSTDNFATEDFNTERSRVDARPILLRSEANQWEKTEQTRKKLYHLIENICQERGIEALVLQSDPYVHPAWVKFESWLPVGERTVTARSSMTVTFKTMPFHRYETIYKVDWQKLGRSGTMNELYAFGDHEVGAMINFLRTIPSSNIWYARVKSIFKPVQLRQKFWHFWKPKNNVVAVRKDWFRIGSFLLIFIGAFLVALNMFLVALGLLAPETISDDSAPTEEGVLYSNQEIIGVLDESDRRLDNGVLFDQWKYTAQAGERFIVFMRSNQMDTLDTHLILGQIVNNKFDTLSTNDDASSDDTNSRLEFIAPEFGDYLIRASSYEPGEAGSYTLLVQGDNGSENLSALPIGDTSESKGGSLLPIGIMLMILGTGGFLVTTRAPELVRSAGKPLSEPRILSYLDAWQTVLFGAGKDADEIKNRLLQFFQNAHQQQFFCSVERIWHWGLDGKTDREQIVLRYGRGLVFCQVYEYGSDLYMGWDAHLNVGTWKETELVKGIDRETGKRVRVMTVEQAVQSVSEYDLVDLNCLLEWTHAQVTQVIRNYIKECEIDQEIDFTIIRGDRQSVTHEDEKQKKTGRFRRKA